MMQKNYELIQKGFRILHPQMAGFIGQEMNRVYKDEWWQEALSALSDQSNLPGGGDYAELIDSLDIANCLRLIDRKWYDVFKTKLSISHRTWAKELMGVRNDVAHIGLEDVKQGYAERALDTMALLCEAFDAESTEELRALYRTLRYGSEQGSTAAEVKISEQTGKNKSRSEVLTKNVGDNLPSWREVIEPHPDVAEGRYRTAEFAADLSQVSKGKGEYEYRDPVEFFSRTYVTEGMSGLLLESLQRLAGIGGEPVIQLKTAFGGGKTHSMLALYHMIHGRKTLEYIPSLKVILDKAGISEIPAANIAVLVGTALDPAKKRNPPNFPGYTVSTMWGELAYQLVTSAGKPELYAKYIREADRKGVSPGSENLKNLFDECGPCLILMDEIVAYARKLYGRDDLPAGSFDNFIVFIQEITEAARASENSIVVASIPESDIEIGGEAGRIALDTIEHTFGRMESVWKPVAANEGFEVVRRRLFQECSDEAARDAVCDAFSAMYRENSEDFPFEAKEVEYRDRMVSCYPIHPEVFERLYGDWATLEKFQRTRGVLRLMAAVIHELWMANDAGAMIMPGSMPLDTSAVKDELIRYLPENWNSIVDREVDGKDSIPYQKDKAIARYGALLACRRISRTIMMGSAPGMSALRAQGVRGIEINQILLGAVQPGEAIAVFKDALNTLHGSLSYLYCSQNGTRYWFDTKPTLRKTAEDRASQVPSADVDMEIENRLRKIRREKPFAGVHPCPASSGDVPDEQAVRLVILRTTDSHQRNKDTSPARKAAAEILDNRGTAPRIYRNMLAFVAPDAEKLSPLKQEVKRYIAWDSILSDKDDLNLDSGQIRETESNIKQSNTTVDRRIKETYCWLLVPNIDRYEDIKTVQWDITDLGGGEDDIVLKATRRMKQTEQVIDKWAPALLEMCLDDILWKESDDIQIKKLWEYLSTYCYLPRLSGFSVLEDAVMQGLSSEEYFGLAAAHSGERYIDLRFGQTVSSINQSDLLVKPDVARKQIEAERKPVPAPDNAGSDAPFASSDSSADTGSGGRPPVSDTTAVPTSVTPLAAPKAANKHFYMSVDLNYTRINRDIPNYVQEILSHLNAVDGARMELKLEVEVDAENGIPAATVRTVTENCKTLKVTDFGFDD